MKSYTINKNFIAAAGQQIFTLQKPFISGCINVFLNGVLQELGEDKNYIELPDVGQVVFNTELVAGDQVSIISNIENANITMEVVSSSNIDKPNSLFKKYTSVPKLHFNNKYAVIMVINNQVTNWSFNTRMTPMFSTVKKILEDCGEFLQGFTEEYIMSMIHRNSMELIDLIDELRDGDDNIENVTISNDADGIHVATPARLASNWVRTKTEYDLIYARFYGMALQYGSISKEIGDISIEKQTDLPGLDDLLKRKKQEFQTADAAIRNNGILFAGSAVKGATNFEYSERSSF